RRADDGRRVRHRAADPDRAPDDRALGDERCDRAHLRDPARRQRAAAARRVARLGGDAAAAGRGGPTAGGAHREGGAVAAQREPRPPRFPRGRADGARDARPGRGVPRRGRRAAAGTPAGRAARDGAARRTGLMTAIDPATTVGPVHLTVADLDRSIEYYELALGLSAIGR